MQKVIEFAKHKLNEFGLNDYRVIINNRITRSLGKCKPLEKEIHVSGKLIKAESGLSETVKQVILHEIAHAIDFDRSGKLGHGAPFKAVCKEIGCTLDGTQVHIKHDLNPPRYEVRLGGIVVARYVNKPRSFDPATMFIAGHKKETLGKLSLHKINQKSALT